jgi:hypothetical protein
MRFTEVASDLQDFIAMGQLLRRERVSFGSGYGIQWTVMTDTSGAAKNTGLFEVDSVNVGDVLQQANIPWRHCNTNYAIERREVAMNRSPARIVELLTVRRTDAMVSMAELMETNFWNDPADDGLTPFGVDYWVPKGTNTTPSFGNTANPTNFTAGAGSIDASVYTRWAPWSGRYVNVTKDDLVRKWRKAATFTKFMPAPRTNAPTFNTGDRYGYYTNYDVVGVLEEALEAQNENLGNDIASKDGRLLFRQVPVTWVPQLENDSQDPVYGINWGVFKPVFLRGEFMREMGPRVASNQHTVLQVHVDCTLNWICRDRRRIFQLNIA